MVAYALGLRDPGGLAALGAAVGAIPGAVTYAVANGGVRGVIRKVWGSNGR
jgi:hypothetical protein